MYYIIEIQKSNQGTYAHLIDNETEYNQAESKYYGKLQYAAVSTIPVHTVYLLDDKGVVYHEKCYNREQQAEA